MIYELIMDILVLAGMAGVVTLIWVHVYKVVNDQS